MADKSYLPVIRTITNADGASISPADELRIGAGLDVSYVPGPGVNGPGYVSLRATPVAPVTTYPPAGMAFDAGDPVAGSDHPSPIVFASLDGPTHIGTIYFIALRNLAASNTNYLIVDIVELDDSGSVVGASKFTGTTEITASDPATTASGNWVSTQIAWEIGLGIEIASGHRLFASWTHGGAGVVRPPGVWRIT